MGGFGGFGSGRSGTIVFFAEPGVDDVEVQAAMTKMFVEADEIEGVTLTSPYSLEGQQRGLVAATGDQAGLIAYAQVEPEAGLAILKGDIESDPDSDSAWGALGDAYRDLGRTAKAKEAYSKARALDPADWRWNTRSANLR